MTNNVKDITNREIKEQIKEIPIGFAFAGSSRLLESVSVTNDSSAAEEALTNLFGLEIPLDAGVESAADAIAEKLGLQPKNSTIQTGVFVLTKAAILETASLVGLGSGLAKLDLSFKMAQLAKQVEAIDKKLDVILSAPLKLAVDFFVKAMCRLENENISGTIEDITKVRDHAMQAFRYAEGQGPKIEHLKSSVLAKSLTIVAEILLESNNNQTIVPFSLLDERKKRTIASLIEIEVNSVHCAALPRLPHHVNVHDEQVGKSETEARYN